jgi:hypothetical protein
MFNLITEWERVAKRAMSKRHFGLNEEGAATQYAKALAYCDCITNFTDDESRWDCYDRLVQEMLAEIEADEVA